MSMPAKFKQVHSRKGFVTYEQAYELGGFQLGLRPDEFPGSDKVTKMRIRLRENKTFDCLYWVDLPNTTK